ncbi:Serine/threonine-protein phosphatase 6 regulatory ankyrin repeat subunit B [Phytophthora cinnamomi]|uniref:Serine/threonine-protein phosphatase 6 regulatory ankyrin repeat subunit B n=1 Tax=Phytophthora cinnamomi TaxID=4785 RepID=UPI0035599607|nr:Serine/threonine-protein phosphatase 6 regulatory ankyrin repeat subunit B [Phytophthora cinnamomi]
MQTPTRNADANQPLVDSPTAVRAVPHRTQRRCPALHAAAWEGDTSALTQLLERGENPNVGDEWNLTPIMSMFMRHSLQDTRCVFRGRDTIQRNLVVDCREEDAEREATTSAVLMLLLQHGADPDARSDRGKTALHYATNDGLYEAAKILLDAGASIDAQDKDGQSPLYCAVQEHGLLVTNLLLSNGASIDLQDNRGVSPLALAIQKGYVDIMQLFLNHYSLVATRERLDFAGNVLLQAVEEDSANIVKLLPTAALI